MCGRSGKLPRSEVRPSVRWNHETLKDHLDAAMRTASALLAENYVAQDRRRLIHCIEQIDQAVRAIEGGVWVWEHAPAVHNLPAAPPPRPASMFATVVPTDEPLRHAG